MKKALQLCVLAAMLAAPVIGQAAANSGAAATGTSSAGGCPSITAEAQAAEQQVYANAQNLYGNMVPQPANLQSSTCFSNILNMGSNIGLSFFNPANLLSQMEQMACSAAQNALQWPVQQAASYVNNNAQLPYGLGGASVNPSTSGGVNVTNNGSSSGPSLGLPNTGNSTLNNILN